ncbi:hypothetical protein V5O48_019215, partial [Marasmius crinis-equi]
MPSPVPLSRVPQEKRAMLSIRPPSPVNRETGSFFVGYQALPGGPFEVPKVFSSCRTDSDRGTTFIKTAVEHVNGWVITTTTKLQRIHPDNWDAYLASVDCESDSDGFPTPAGSPQAVATQLPLGGTIPESPEDLKTHTNNGTATPSFSDDFSDVSTDIFGD